MSRIVRVCAIMVALGLMASIGLRSPADDQDNAATDAQAEPKSSADKQFDQLIADFNEFGQTIRPHLDPNSDKDAFRENVLPPLKKLLKDAEALSENEDATPQHAAIAERVQMQLVQLGSRDADFVAEIVKSKPGSDLAAMAEAQSVVNKLQSGELDHDKTKKELDDFASRYENSDLPVQLYGFYAQMLESVGKEKEAIELCETVLKKYPESPSAEQLRTTLKNLQLVGSPIELSGPTLAGSNFKIESIKGKVVLVDFWATWCGPCVQSMPALQKIHQEYNEKGFEIVGVSLDNSKEALKGFVEENEIPWTQIYYDNEQNPLAEKYGVTTIPRMILVGRDGKVVASSIRGEEAIEEAVKRELAKSADVKAN